MNFIKLTHFSTGNVTYLKSEDITSVSQGFDRTLVICNNGQGAHYREGAEYIMDLIHGGEYPPAVEYAEEPRVCSLGPLPEPIKNIPLYQVVAKWDASFNNDVEINTFKELKDALELYKDVIANFQDSISGILDVDDCDFSEMDAQLPSIYMVDTSGEDSVRVYIQEVTVL